MENLKITKTLTSLVLMGTITLTGCSMPCKVKEKHYHIYSSDDGFIYSTEENKDNYSKEKESLIVNEKNQNLVIEDRFPLTVVIDYVEDKVNNMDAFVEALYAEPFINKKGKIDFNTYWRFLSNEELVEEHGIVRTGDSISYVVYDINGERYEVDNLRDLDGEYFVDMDELICINDPVEMNYYKKEVVHKR